MSDVSRTETDVVVVGGGGAGLAAAIEAGRAGARVVLLEKNPALGGTTLRSVGSITATGTELQARAGIEDSTQAHFEDLALFNIAAVANADSRDNTELRRVLVENVPDAIRFLSDMGIVFFGPMSEAPHRVPRMHNVLPHASAFIRNMAREAAKTGVDVLVNVRAETLLRDGKRVTGVRGDVNGATQEFMAAGGVVLAAGDFSNAASMKARFVSADIAAIPGINPTSTGDGQRLGEQAGGVIVNGDVMAVEVRFTAPPGKAWIDLLPPSRPLARLVRLAMRHLPPSMLRPFLMMFVTTHLAPSRKLFEEGAILINRNGFRFTDESGEIQFEIAKQPANEAFIVFDTQVAEKFTAWPNFISTAPGVAYAYLADYRRNRRDIFHQAASLDALAARIGVPGEALAEGAPFTMPPFYALGPLRSWIAFADGGLRVSPGMEVLSSAGEPIPGLYAAGSCGQGGVLLEGHGHHLAWAFTSGRIAGHSAATGNG